MTSRRVTDARRATRAALDGWHDGEAILCARVTTAAPDVIVVAHGQVAAAAAVTGRPLPRTRRLELWRWHVRHGAVPLVRERADGRWAWWMLTGPNAGDREPVDLEEGR